MVTLSKRFSYALNVACANCKKQFALSALNTYAHCCNQPLEVEYDYLSARTKDDLISDNNTMWRYAAMLPIIKPGNIVSLGEGMTPLFSLNNLAARHGFSSLLIKDESLNPTGSFKARGLSMAVSKAKELNINEGIIPTAGNAGGALAAYCAKANMKCTVVMPRRTPQIFKQECELYGANLILVDGLINDCAKKTEELKLKTNAFDFSTLKEPYRLEGKKTMGYEIAEQLNWNLPDFIIYPAGGGTGLIGIWKAFQEMMKLGWIKGKLPKMIAVQAINCNPLMRSLIDPVNWKEDFIPQPSIANGLAVPYPFGLDMMKKVLHESCGTAISITEEEILEGVKEFSRNEGILISPEGAATWKALLNLRNLHVINDADKILLLNTGSGYKYCENFN